MNIPLNGRIAIVDDKIEEVKPLLRLLSQKRIPFNYYTGQEIEHFPYNADENPITLLFLDLNIYEYQHNAKDVISTLHPILNSICPSKSKPYFIILWSKKLNEFADELDKHFQTDVELSKKKPTRIIRLNKSDYFLLENDEYRFDDIKFQILQDKLQHELSDKSLMTNLLNWENIVHQETSLTSSEFSSLYIADNDWDINMKAVMFHLAKSVIGETEIIKAIDEQRLVIAFSNFNSFLSERINSNVKPDKLGPIFEIKDGKWEAKRKEKKGSLNDETIGRINSKLHLSINFSKIDSFNQGNIYRARKDISLLEKIVQKGKLKPIDFSKILESKPQLIQLDITPVCDYSQDKNYVRLLYGVLLNSSNYNYFKDNYAYQMRSPIFLIGFSCKFFLFDFRFITTTSKRQIIKRNSAPRMKLKREMCSEILSKLVNQINRPGMSHI